MDLKIKGITWAGSIYDKFETICQKSNDYFARQEDTVNSGGNHEQNVGESVKCEAQILKPNTVTRTNMYSMSNIDKKSQDIGLKQSYVEPNVNDIAKNKLNQASSLSEVHQVNEHTPTEWEDFDFPLGEDENLWTPKYSDMSITNLASKEPSPSEEPKLIARGEKNAGEGQLCSELISEGQLWKEPSPSEESKIIARGEKNAGEGQLCSELISEGQLCKEPSPSEESKIIARGEKNAGEGQLFSEFINEGHKNALNILTDASPASSVHGDGLRSHQNKKTICNIMDEPDRHSDVESSLPSSGLENEGDGQLCSDLINEGRENALNILTEASPASSVHGDGFKSHQNEKMICNIMDEPDLHSDVMSSLPSPGLESSVVYSGNRSSEMEYVFSGCSLPTESVSESTITTGKSPKETQVAIIDNDARMCGSSNSNTFSSRSVLSLESVGECTIITEKSPKETQVAINDNDARMCDSSNSNTFPESLQSLPCENEVADMRVASSSSVLSLESTDVDSSRICDCVTHSWLSGNSRDQSCECTPLGSCMSSSEIGRLDNLADPCMETIDLCDKMKLEESCVIVNSDVLHGFSRRAGKIRSYKKLIQDAFTSKRRLAKEYEQLGLWYGDVNFDHLSIPHASQNMLPSFPSTSLELKKLPGQASSDTEWELL